LTTAFAQLQFLPSQIEVIDTLPGTNDYLKEKAAVMTGLPEGQVVWALHQTNGKGQSTNKWLTEPGQNITLSVLLRPENLPASEAFLLSKAIALAVHHTVAHFVKTGISIKWPNDIFAGSQKIAGILIENIIQGDLVKQSVVGIGLNVNQTVFLSDNNPTSLAKITGRNYVLSDIVAVLFENISSGYHQLQLKNNEKINRDYFRNLYNTGTAQPFLIHDQLRYCFINEVLGNGCIILTIDGKEEVYLYGEAKWKL
jgi:BirA family biotin operon repressor/biotin-[acetyl-CoA-carboxylase] ligase